jgi:DNA repair photolyase
LNSPYRKEKMLLRDKSMFDKNVKKKIISVSRRTDIPAFYSEWFINRIREGFCYVPHPIYPQRKLQLVNLRPEDVEIIAFWTRDPLPLMRYLPELDKRGYKYYFQYTIVGYPKIIDPKSPPLQKALKTFQNLSDRIGKEKVVWRYDPILFSNLSPYEWHIKQISDIARQLRGKTERLVISFIDPYRKTTRRLSKETGRDFQLSPETFNPESYKPLAQWIGLEVQRLGMEVVTCAERLDLYEYGIAHGKCIDDALISRILGREIVSRKDPGQRKHCGCVVSKDIGVNCTCVFGCKYCYATQSIAKAQKNFREHDPSAPCLVKWAEDCEVPQE